MWKALNEQQSEELSGGWSYYQRTSYNTKTGRGVSQYSSSLSDTYQPVGEPGWADYTNSSIYDSGYYIHESSYAEGTPGNGKSPIMRSESSDTYTYY